MLAYFLGQKKVVEQVEIPSRRARSLVTAIGSRYHVLIFWGFLIITVGTAETLVQGLFPTFSLALLLGDAATRWLATIIDWSNLARAGDDRLRRAPPGGVRAPADPDEPGTRR